MFLEKIEKFNPKFESLNTNSNSYPELICTVKSPSCCMAQFFPTYVTLKKDGTQKNFDYDEFAAISVKKSGTNISITLNKKNISYDTEEAEKANQDAEFLKSLVKTFEDGSSSSPYENVRLICEENGIFFDGNYNKYLYHLIFEYHNFFNLIVQNGVLSENCSIEYILEDHTAGILDNASGTATSLVNSFFSGNLVGSLMNAGKRIAKSIGNEIIGNSGILVVTNENVIYTKGDTVQLIGDDLQDALDSLEAERDETMQGAMDIFYDGTKILDNVSGKFWSEYRNTVRNLKNHPKQNLIEDDSEYSEESNSFSENLESKNSLFTEDDIEEKLTKLKRMADNGLISNDDYEKKKNEILGIETAPQKSNESQQVQIIQSQTSQPQGKAPPLEKKQVENIATNEKPKKMHGCLRAFLITIGVTFGLFVLLVIIAMFSPE